MNKKAVLIFLFLMLAAGLAAWLLLTRPGQETAQDHLTLYGNIDLYADLQGLVMQERPPRYAELMHMTGLTPFSGRLAGKLSGGMKQKLGLACTAGAATANTVAG